MLPGHAFLQLLPARVPPALQRVRDLIWTPLPGRIAIEATAPAPLHVDWNTARRLPRRPVAGPHPYGQLWDQRWFRLRLPAESRGAAPRYLKWMDQAEATLFVDGVPHYGFDVAHRIAPLPRGAREVWVESVVSQTAIWHPDATGLDPAGSRFEGATLLARDELAWQVWHDLAVLDDLMRVELKAVFPDSEAAFGSIGAKPPLERIPPLLRRLLRHLDDALNALEVGGLPAARRALGAAYRDLPGHNAPPAAVLTGHAHIDLVWLWPERVGEFKAVHTFATANRLLEAYPEFRFGYSQPASYAAVARRAPALDRAVRRRIRQRRWEPVGATEVESDTLIACGEALLRSFLLGQEGFRSLTGKPSPVLWLPDVFGYAGCLPQLMRECDVRAFFTTKLTWNAVNRFPYSSFVWAGFDGSEVVAHLCHDNGYNQNVAVAELRRGAETHRQCDVHPEFLAPTGFGDGGGGVTEEMCERVRRVANLSGLPPSRWGRIDEFFERLESRRDRLPVHRGELYLEYHRGTFTTHGNVKAAFRDLERALQLHEAARCARGRGPIDPAPWRRLVFAQFHDYIPGSSIHEVYAEGLAEHAALAASARVSAARELGAKSGGEALFNPLPHPRRVLHAGRLVDLPPLGGGPVRDLPSIAAPAVAATRSRLQGDRVDARFDARGRLTALRVDGVAIPFTAPANDLWVYPDQPHRFEAWDIDRHTLSCGRADSRRADARVEDAGPGRATVAFTRPIGTRSTVTVRYTVEAGCPALRIAYDLDWHEEAALLKAVFPTAFAGSHARFGAPFASVRRPQTGGSMTAEAMWEVPMSRWCAVTDDAETEGFSVVAEAKYGVTCRAGALGVSLLRSALITNEDRGARAGSHPESIRRTLAPSRFSDQGPQRIQLAVGRFDSVAPRVEQPAALAELLFTPPLSYRGGPVSCGFSGLEGGESLQPVWAKPEKDGAWVLRLHETLGRRGRARVYADDERELMRVDLSGRKISELRGGRLDFRPYEILSVRFGRPA
ncbi:MAG TPA: glycoside hydrolase family 38 C-terminal domain-containing protein [Kiritimatiellia bacterium]|nr:glycoside hydrolase family 38 C-terminal domain-containing protein [Kiritimatiellia bacterium]